MSKEMWSQVSKFSDGQDLNAEVLNVPIGQLGARTDYLYARIKELLSSGKMSSVVITDVGISAEDGKQPDVGSIVYLNNQSGLFEKAKATMSLYDDFTAAESSFTIGILQRKQGAKGDVVVYGIFNLSRSGNNISIHTLIESGESYRPGRYYLSSNEDGKLTAHPNGPLIYVCTISGDVSNSGFFVNGNALINPQFLDIGTSHVHRTAVLSSKFAGTMSTRGYLPANYDPEHPERSIAIRFGGTFTADHEVAYKFWFRGYAAAWGNVVLYWKEWPENGESTEHHINILGPDIEVPISNGITARISFPRSSSTYAYSGLEDDQIEWPVLYFPTAGKGWLDHTPTAIATSDGDDTDSPKAHVAISGGFDAVQTEINVAFPRVTQILLVGSVNSGSTITYGDTTYEFVLDSDSYTGDNTPLDLGPTLADSVLNLAIELDKKGLGRFAVLSSPDGSDAKMVAMDAEEVETSASGIFISKSYERITDGYDVIGSVDIKMVLFDGNNRIVGTSGSAANPYPVIKDVESFMWHDVGNGRKVLVFQDASGSTAQITAGSIMTCTLYDDEPGASYDYSIGFEPSIANYWPPIPVKSAALIVDGIERSNKALVEEDPGVSFGGNTIHWFKRHDEDVPWPLLLSRKNEVMHWVRGFQGATGPVTSIQVREGSPFKIVGYGTDRHANTGDLEIVGDLDIKAVNGGAPGFIVPKRVRNGKLIGGPVVERIVGGAGIAVISQAGSPNGQGTVIVALDNGAYHSQFSDIALENAEQAKIGMFPYIRLKGYATFISSPSAFTAMMRVPTNLPDGKYALKVQAAVFGENGFNDVSKKYACVSMSYNILPDFRVGEGMEYMNLKTSLLKPDTERTVLIPFGHEVKTGIEYEGFDPILVKTDDGYDDDKDDVVSNAFGAYIPSLPDFAEQSGVVPELRPGNLVGIRVSRIVTPSEYEAYTGPIGFINLSWSLVSVDGAGTSSRFVTENAMMEIIKELQTEVSGKVSKNALSGVEVTTNTPAGIREAVKELSNVVGADVVK